MIFVSMDARSAAVYWVLLVVQWLLCSIYFFFPFGCRQFCNHCFV